MASGLPLPALVPTESAMRRALRRARDGASLDASEATVLLHARGAHLDDLLASAARVRDAGLVAAGRPGIISYSRKVFIPLTRLCRDRCGYCTFATVPGRLPAPYLSPDQVLDIARKGAELGCKEALFTLGDRPEDRWPTARTWLHAHGYDDTLSYVRAAAIQVLEQTGLLPHLNPGVLTWQDFQRLKPVAPSMGMMLETTAQRLYAEPGGPHFGSPDKDPEIRLRVLEDAGRCGVPFTTGILVGIGETYAERAHSLFAIRQVSRRYNGIQETIVQNFRAKPDTRMRNVPDAELEDLAATIAVARLVLGPRMRIQAPPNLVDAQYELMLRAGIDDWGGVSPVTPDHVNPERPWPDIDELAARTAAEILDDEVRWVLTKGKLPAAAWVEVITTAHRLGIPTTATIMYGHVDTPAHLVRHIRLIAAIQAETDGFTEFVLLPFVHHNAPIYLAGIARPGPTQRENRALHAVARLLLHGLIPNIQCSWVKLGVDGCRQVLRGGVNDVGGTLMEETISRMAGSEHGSYKTISDIEAMVAPTGRPLRQRTTGYGRVSAERRAAALASDGVCASVRRPATFSR